MGDGDRLGPVCGTYLLEERGDMLLDHVEAYAQLFGDVGI